MSFDRMFREMVREEIERQLAPFQSALDDLAHRLSPLLQLSGGRRGARIALKLPRAGARGGRRVRSAEGASRGCALQGCKRPARSKGYCAAHYQKYRMLARTHRLPGDWKEYAPESSVKDIVLPRGRAAAKLLKASRK